MTDQLLDSRKRKQFSSSSEDFSLKELGEMETNGDSQPVSNSQTLSAIYESLSKIHEKLDSVTGTQTKLQTDVHGPSGIEERLQEVTEHTNDQDSMLAELRGENRKLQKEVELLKSFVVRLERKVDQQHEELLDLKSRSMRDNLVLHGLKEEKGENLKETFQNVLKEGLKIDKAVPIDRIHRLGKLVQGRNRPVVVKFSAYQDRELVMEKKKNLAQTKPDLHFSPQFPEEVRDRRNRAYDVQKQYDPKTVKTKLLHDKLLFVDSGTTFKEKVQLPKADSVLSEVDSTQNKVDVKHSATIHGHNNTLVARAAGASTLKEARDAVRTIVSQPDVIRARANVMVYRIQTDNDKVTDGYDDDGDTGVGKQVLQLMRKNNVKNVVVVVTRDGNAKMGPQRFAQATECVKDVLHILTSETASNT